MVALATLNGAFLAAWCILVGDQGILGLGLVDCEREGIEYPREHLDLVPARHHVLATGAGGTAWLGLVVRDGETRGSFFCEVD